MVTWGPCPKGWVQTYEVEGLLVRQLDGSREGGVDHSRSARRPRATMADEGISPATIDEEDRVIKMKDSWSKAIRQEVQEINVHRKRSLLLRAVFLWFYAQNHADELGIKKKKKVSNKKLQRDRAKYTQVGGD
eukprot:751317-Hanusia_phi.AAC.7